MPNPDPAPLEPLDLMLAPFAKHLYDRRAAELTIRTFCEGLRLFVAWYEHRHGRRPAMPELSRTDMADYQHYLRTTPTAKTGQPAKPATRDKRFSALRAYYAYLKEQDESVRSPLDRIRYELRGAPRQPESLDDRQLAKLLVAARECIVLADDKRKHKDRTKTACEARRDYALVSTLAYAGLRASELCALSIDDVDLSPSRCQLVVRRGKGNKHREVELSNDARKALSEWLAWRGHYGIGGSCRAVFVGRRGQPLSVRAVEVVVGKIARRAQASGLDAHVTPHTLRHAFARRLVDKGTPLRDVQDLMGHESIVTTSRYTRPSKSQRKADVDKLDIEI